uniref:CS domain-containing protein n=1 Tax=Heterorhabditis bacteriophora TaxID=37862 RepID=A0A1I7XCD7_HETBA
MAITLPSSEIRNRKNSLLVSFYGKYVIKVKPLQEFNVNCKLHCSLHYESKLTRLSFILKAPTEEDYDSEDSVQHEKEMHNIVKDIEGDRLRDSVADSRWRLNDVFHEPRHQFE